MRVISLISGLLSVQINKKNSDNFIPLEDRFGKEERVPLGEKGIGRLSVTYLGNHMLNVTKKLINLSI